MLYVFKENCCNKQITEGKMNTNFKIGLFVLSLCLCIVTAPCFAQVTGKEKIIDEKVQKFLDKMRNKWHDLNVPEADGKILYDIIIQHKYKKALELGTSTGLSGIWIAWALSKTGGKLITVEIDEGRHKEAVANFKEAGLSEFIDARLADAHKLVTELPGPFDFVFIDADKEWYTNYAKALVSKLEVGGCITAHNVVATTARGGGRGRGGFGGGGTGDYYQYMKSLLNFETSMAPGNVSGVSVSYKTKEK
jgi:predicted O-methyltransferase YrrM